MRPREAVVAVYPPDSGPLRARWYRALAFALAASGEGSAAVFEATHAARAARVLLRPASVVATLAAGPFSASVPVATSPVPAAPRPPSGFSARSYVLQPAVAPRPTWSRPPLSSGGIRLDRLVGPTGWLGVQTFWVRRANGALAVARRLRVAVEGGQPFDGRAAALLAGLVSEWSDALGLPATVRLEGRGARREWERAAASRIPPTAWVERSPGTVEPTAEVLRVEEEASDLPAGPTLVVGASGAGKTTYLARRAADAIAAGAAVIAVDLHGDLAPAIVGRLSAARGAGVVAVDATDRPVPGVALLGDADPERAAAHLVAALKRLSPDGTDLYWGFRLERIFDSFVRLVQEEGGSLADLYGLLTDPARRDTARLATRRDDLARFLDELGAVVRRNPEFLWSAATRLSKVVLVPALGELLAPRDAGLPVDRLLAAGRSVLVRLPFARLGPESAQFAATLVLGRLYLAAAARDDPGAPGRPRIVVVLDEVHGFSPRLVAEILTEGRKFGVVALVATQYPDRLAPEVRAAAAGSLAEYVAFRVPPATSREVGAWLGVSPTEAAEFLPHLAPGHAVATSGNRPGVRPIAPALGDLDGEPGAWTGAVARTRREFPPADVPDGPAGATEAATERLLLAVLGGEERGRPLGSSEAIAAALELPGTEVDPAVISDRWTTVRRQGLVTIAGESVVLSPAGERALGLGAATGATRESARHRALLLRAFRVFARHGAHLEIVRQGRFDTTLPDARFRQLPFALRPVAPSEVAERIERVRGTWAWRAFRGRDVEVEAEVSGARRAERVRRGWRKAVARNAYALFLVDDPVDARRLKEALRRLGAGPDRAQVWTLRPSDGTVGPDANR